LTPASGLRTQTNEKTQHMKHFDIYGMKAADETLSFTEMSGRYSIQAEGLKRTVADIFMKLDIQPSDRLLDIGCGVGDLTIPLSMTVAETTCVDHPAILERLKQRVPKEPICYLPGDFTQLKIDKAFDKIMAYGVVICLASKDEVVSFIDKASGLLAPGGRMLLGDFVNLNKKQRFLSSKTGDEFSKQWEKLMAAGAREAGGQATFQQPTESVFQQIDDAFICELLLRYRQRGFDVYLLPQPCNLPFGYTREDILFVRPL
jgi:2-polyprenyl-3-methyl-5-hydroxy-6-metoxy-1,4-benzoquinol methylase